MRLNYANFIDRFFCKIVAVVTSYTFNLLYIVDGGQGAILFDRFRGVLDGSVGEGTHLLIPSLQKPIRFDVRTRPQTLSTVSGTKDLQVVNLTLHLLSHPEANHLPQIFRTLWHGYDEKVFPSICNEKNWWDLYLANQLSGPPAKLGSCRSPYVTM